MADQHTNGQSESRLDRIERALDLLVDDHIAFRDEHKQLLTAQVVLTDRVDKLAIGMREMQDAQRHTDERMDALISVVGGVVRHQPPHAP